MIIVKIGGGNDINVEAIIRNLSELKEKFIIVHGANASRDTLAKDLKSPKKVVTSLKGYSSVLTDEKSMDVMMMAYSGLRNKRIVELCQQNNINAIGLTGLDGKLVQGKRNLGIKTIVNGKKKILRDFSGKPKSINKELITLLVKNSYVPVLTQPIIDENNFAINSENDDLLVVLQKTLNAAKIISLIEAPGFLEDKDDESSLVKQITRKELEEREQQVDGRMKRKLLALKNMFAANAKEVIISDGRTNNPVRDALEGKGTTIK
jgi:[amino group carrier protein]-L-2-aminoadipate 6-kinase